MRHFPFIAVFIAVMLLPAAQAWGQSTSTGPGARPEILNAIPPDSYYPPPPPTTHLLGARLGSGVNRFQKRESIFC